MSKKGSELIEKIETLTKLRDEIKKEMGMTVLTSTLTGVITGMGYCMSDRFDRQMDYLIKECEYELKEAKKKNPLGEGG